LSIAAVNAPPLPRDARADDTTRTSTKVQPAVLLLLLINLILLTLLVSGRSKQQIVKHPYPKVGDSFQVVIIGQKRFAPDAQSGS